MPLNHRSPFAPLLRKLQLRADSHPAERDALVALPHKITTIEAGAYIIRAGEQSDHSSLLITGLASRQKTSALGARSIGAIHLPGDIVDLQTCLLGPPASSIQTLTRARIISIPRQAMLDLAARLPEVGQAMWHDTQVDASISREWIFNLARRSAQMRIAHVLCEFGVRLEWIGLGDRSSYELPMTQDQLADVTGLTPVHVSRSFTALKAAGLLERTSRHVTIADWPGLQAAAEFDEAYLHLDPRGP